MKESKYDRILSIYSMLNAGEIIHKKEIALKFGVSERTVQRDIDDIRAFFANNTLDICYGKEVVYDKSKQGYMLKSADKELLTNSEILALCKILLESRSLIKSEMQPILDKIIQRCVSEVNKKPLLTLLITSCSTTSSHGITSVYLISYGISDLQSKKNDIYRSHIPAPWTKRKLYASSSLWVSWYRSFTFISPHLLKI